MRSLDFKNCDGIQVSCRIDGGGNRSKVLSSRTLQDFSGLMRPDKVQKVFGTSAELIDGKWVLYGAVFAELGLGKNHVTHILKLSERLI